MKKILLLNPPGRKLYLRCYYHSKVSKANFVPSPIDLVFLSGVLSQDYDIELLDAIVGKLDDEKCLREISKIRPDIIISLAGAVSWVEDIQFFKKLKDSNDCCLILNGDLLLEGGKKKLKQYPFIDAIILDFTTKDVLHYLSGDYKKVKNMIYRDKRKIITAPIENKKREFDIPMPNHELFKKYKYRMPFMKNYPLATVLTDFGCPYTCGFCIMAHFKFKYRKVDDVVEELKYIKSIGIDDVWFHDQTFGAIKRRNTELCKKIIKNQIRLNWFCFSRVDIMDKQTLKLMKKAGCHLIMFGVESANEKILKSYKKGYSLPQIKKAFNYAKEVGIKTMGTFLIGLPEDDMESCLKTIKLAFELGCDYASFNFAVPRVNTKLRETAIRQNLIEKWVEGLDQAGTQIAMPTYNLSKKDLQKLRRKALITFYLRPSYILKRILSIDSFSEFRIQINEVRGMLKNLF